MRKFFAIIAATVATFLYLLMSEALAAHINTAKQEYKYPVYLHYHCCQNSCLEQLNIVAGALLVIRYFHRYRVGGCTRHKHFCDAIQM